MAAAPRKFKIGGDVLFQKALGQILHLFPLVLGISIQAEPFGAVFSIKGICADGDKAAKMRGNQIRMERGFDGSITAISELQRIEIMPRNEGGSIRPYKFWVKFIAAVSFWGHRRVQDRGLGEQTQYSPYHSR